MPHERIIALYEESAAAWDRLRGRGLLERPGLDRFLERVPSGASVLDVGCAMGEPIARYLIEQGARVTGLDSSPSLIGMARERFPDHDWLVGDMRAMDLGRRFDGIIAWHSLFHLTAGDQRGMFARFAAHLKRGGQLLFTSGHSDGELIGEWQGEPLYHASLSPGEYRGLLAASGLEVIDCRLQDRETGNASVWLAQMSPPSGDEGSA